MAYEVIQLHKEDGLAVVTLNRPPVNPLNNQLFRELDRAADELQSDDTVKAVIITGAGDKAFAAGADITELIKLTAVEAYNFCQVSRVALEKIANQKNRLLPPLTDSPWAAAVSCLWPAIFAWLPTARNSASRKLTSA